MPSGSRSQLRHLLSFGGQAPVGVGALIALMLVFTVLSGMVKGLALELALSVLTRAGGELLEPWRLVTWAFVQPLGDFVVLDLIFLGIALFFLARQLSYAWSERQFLVRFALLTVGTGLLTELLWWALGGGFVHAGMWPVVNGLLLTWALLFPRQQIGMFFGAMQMTGLGLSRWLALGTPIYALAMGRNPVWALRIVEFAPHLLALLLGWILVAGGPRRLLNRLESWWDERRMARARRKFKVIDTRKPPKSYLN